MQTTGIFEVHEVIVPFTTERKPVYVIPFGDIHYSSKLCHREKFDEWCEWAAQKENAYFLGMGDYDDLGSTSERKLLNSKDLHEATIETLDELYLRHTWELCEKLQFMKGKLIGLMEGNHYGEFQSGITTTQKMCDILGAKYLGVNAFIRLTLRQTSAKSKHSCSVDIWAHHGKGAARLAGGSLNTVEAMVNASESDIYLMGHDHKKSVAYATRLYLGESNRGVPKLKERKILLARTGSFLRGYVPGKVSYVADRALSPSNLGTIKIELTPRRHGERHDGIDRRALYVDIHASV